MPELLAGRERRQISSRNDDRDVRLARVPRDPAVPVLPLERAEIRERDAFPIHHGLANRVDRRVDHPPDVRLAQHGFLRDRAYQAALVHDSPPGVVGLFLT